jgi:leucyl aminopeptidase
MHAITVSTTLPSGLYQHVIAIEPGSNHSLLESYSQEQLTLLKVESKAGSVATIAVPTGSILAVGFPDRLKAKDFGATAVRASNADAHLVLDLRGFSNSEAQDAALGALLGSKTKSEFRTKNDPERKMTVLIDAKQKLDLTEIEIIAGEVLSIRELINTPANELWPDQLAKHVRNHLAKTKVEVEIWDEKKLEKEGCGGILSVGKGSARPPRMVIMSYRGGGKHLGLVGKGITFDTGGLSLKPADSMVGMKYDMAGSATVFGAIAAIAKLGLKVNVTAIMAIAENMPSGTATRPGDVIRMRSGKTVEVINTDAEGRLVLGDGLNVIAEYKPDHIVDVATLTGAATIALGNRYAGVMGHGSAVSAMLEAANKAQELLWEMPLPEELRTVLDSEIADMTNAKVGNRAGGMLVGGWFLSEFVDKNQSWAHLDIAGPANNDAAPYSVNPQGASGVMLRSLVELARGMQSK